MRRVRFSAAVSLDGYIAGPNGEHDWIVMDPDIDFMSMMASFDTVLLGRKTFEAAGKQKGGGMPGMRTVVFSRTMGPADCPGALLSDDPVQTVTDLKSADGKDIWLFGGGILFGSLLDLGLVDSVEVALIPVLLGGGIPLLPTPANRAKLKLVDQRAYPRTGTIMLNYAPVA